MPDRQSTAWGVLADDAQQLYLEVLGGATRQDPSPALDQLLEIRLLVRDPIRDGEFVALDPELAGEHWQGALQESARQLLAAADNAKPRLRSLASAYQAVRPREDREIEYLSGGVLINDRLTPLLAECKVELLTAQPHGPRSPHLLEQSYRRDSEILARGASMRTLYRSDVRTDGPTSRWAHEMTNRGARVRTTASPFQRAVIVDRRAAIIENLTEWAGPGPAPDFRAVLVRDEAVVLQLVDQFEQNWARAQPWMSDSDGVEISEVQQRIMLRICEGAEQGAIARELGIGRRTVVNHLIALRELSGTGSLPELIYWWARYEAGLATG